MSDKKLQKGYIICEILNGTVLDWRKSNPFRDSHLKSEWRKFKADSEEGGGVMYHSIAQAESSLAELVEDGRCYTILPIYNIDREYEFYKKQKEESDAEDLCRRLGARRQ